MNETSDISTHEHLALIILYANVILKIKERFVSFVKTLSTTRKDLEEILNSFIKELGLPSETYLVAQSYDGAANMSGHINGLAARVRKSIPRTYYVHCHFHRLNLALESACSEKNEVRNCLGSINSLYSFIKGSAKREQIFLNFQLKQHRKTLKKHCETRWSSRKRSIYSLVNT